MKKTVFALFFLSLTLSAYSQKLKQLVFREETHDFGVVDEAGGSVSHKFVFTNSGNRPVRIVKVQASCGCTTPDWTKEPVAPGKEGFIEAAYNPKGRPGYFNRSLTVTTDLGPEPITLHIKGRVMNDAEPSNLDYPVAKGNLRFQTRSFNLGKVYLRDINVVREFKVLNAGKEAVTFTGNFTHAPYIKIDVQPRVIQPGATATIRLSYNGAQKNQYGFQSDNVEIETDDTKEPVKSFTVFATLEDYFPEMSQEELAKAPQLTLDARSLDLGSIRGEITKVLQVTNTGRQPLEIRAIQPNCTCVTATASKHTLRPGESADITIRFQPAERSGSQNKSITFYSNDPRNPVQRLTFTANVL